VSLGSPVIGVEPENVTNSSLESTLTLCALRLCHIFRLDPNDNPNDNGDPIGLKGGGDGVQAEDAVLPV